MRYSPVALSLSLLFAVSASGIYAGEERGDPRAIALATQGRAELESGETQAAIDAFEAALAVDPSYSPLYVDLADAARAEGLQGKAIRFYREAQERDPKNIAAISGEGEALLARGAVEKARANLARLEDLCGGDCAETRQLAAAIANGPRILSAEAGSTERPVSQN